MKKIIAGLLVMSSIAFQVNAEHGTRIDTTMYVENQTPETFVVAIPGTNHYTSKHNVSVEPGELRSFVVQASTRVNGPLRFALTADTGNNTYSYYEASGSPFPVSFDQADTARIVVIKKIGKDQYTISADNTPAVMKQTTQEAGF
jgi:hypothetical protein